MRNARWSFQRSIGSSERLSQARCIVVGCVLSFALVSCSDDPPVAAPVVPMQIGSVQGSVILEDTADHHVVVSISVADTTVLVDSNGTFVIDSIPVGAYAVVASAEDRIFVPSSINVVVDSGITAQAEFTMLRRRVSDSVPMVMIPAGTYLRGNNEQDLLYVPSAVPRHMVTLSKPFLVARHEVTQGRWNRLMYRNPSPVQGDALPVMNITYDSVIVFCNRLSMLFGLEPVYTGFGGGVVADHSRNGYRLLTEAEWEYAASAGDTTSLYGIDDPIDQYSQDDYERVIKQVNAYAWTEDNSGGAFGTPQPVGQLQPNAYGLYDMVGNVQEFVDDMWSTYTPDAVTDPLVVTPGQSRVARGSSFGHLLLQNHSLRYRESVRWAVGGPSVGFRLARTP